VEQLQINEIVERIDESFGEELPFSDRGLTAVDVEALERVFGDAGYQEYQDDQTNRHIIRVYLTNAVLLGFLPQSGIAAYSGQLETQEGRAALSLHVLMNSVEDAANLPFDPEPEKLTSLRAEAGSPPHLHVVGN
jgi:hypothetical protein